jgi:propanol-preferring alcohol dehydrogenase
MGAGDATETPPAPPEAAILFASVGALVLVALQAIVKGGTVACTGIHMSDISTFPYRYSGESGSSVRSPILPDATERNSLRSAPGSPSVPPLRPFPLGRANEVLARLRDGQLRGAAVLVMDSGCL